MEAAYFMQNFWKKLLLCLPVLALAFGVLAPQGAEARQDMGMTFHGRFV